MASARSRYDAPRHQDGGTDISDDVTCTVTFRHPGYGDAHNIIMVLPALDSAQGGLHHETARIACAIVAGNRWDGYLSEQRTGSRVATPQDGVLLGKEYYFRVSDNAEERYPLVPAFAHWQFPHGDLPSIWSQYTVPNLPPSRALPRQGSLTDALLARDITCRLTDTVEGTEHAHLVPRTEVDWFRQNTMFRYGVAPRPEVEPIDVPHNALLLRSDIHTVFDQRRFAIVLKPSPRKDDRVLAHELAVHLFSPGLSTQFVKLYHRVAMQPLHGISLEYIFARFAWTIFAYSAQFLQQGVKRMLFIVQDGEVSEKELSSDQCFQIYLSRKSRSLSPSKRKRDNRDAVQEDERDAEEDNEDEDEKRHRGRRRVRSRSFVPATATASFLPSLTGDTPWLTDGSTVASDDDNLFAVDPESCADTNDKSGLPVQETVILGLRT